MDNIKQAQNLEKLLCHEGISQAEFARRCGVHQVRVSEWMTGKYAMSVKNAKRVKAAFPAYDMDFILGLSETPRALDRSVYVNVIRELTQKHEKLLRDHADLMRYCERLEQQ